MKENYKTTTYKCSELVGLLIKYNGNIQTIIPDGENRYKRIGCDENGTFQFGIGVTGMGVEYFGDEELPQGSSVLTILGKIEAKL